MSFCASRIASLRGSSRGLSLVLKPKSSSFFLRHFSSKGVPKHPADGQFDYGYVTTERDDRFDGEKPTLDYARGMPQSFSAMRHEQIIQLCVEGSYNARREALIRNVMAVDSVEYDEAAKTVEEIAQENRSLMKVEYLPYQAGIFTAVASGVISWPLIFDKNIAMRFNESFVTTDVPDVKDLETMWEVGSWTWGWMEPAIGQASFFLLVLQFARSQAIKLGIKPYGDAMLARRSRRIINTYPQYNEMFLSWFAESDAMYGKVIGHD